MTATTGEKIMGAVVSVELTLCSDCIVFSANGTDGHCVDCHDGTVCEHVMSWIKRVVALWPAATYRHVTFTTTGDEPEPYFSHGRCDGCGDVLSGDRFDGVALWDE
jgi:hypothetical protein